MTKDFPGGSVAKTLLVVQRAQVQSPFRKLGSTVDNKDQVQPNK